jgi:P4 family phage/plasmid primase-like protien
MEGGGSLSARLAFELEKRIGKAIKCRGSDWYAYNGIKWELVDRNRYKPLALRVQEMNNRNPRRTLDVLNFLEYQKQLEEGEEFCGSLNNSGKDSYLLNFINGTLEISRRTGKILGRREHKKEDMFTLSLGRYDDIPCDFFLKILRQVLPDKIDRILFLNFFATALMPDSRFELALFCVGSGANGKSITTEAIAQALGMDVVTALTLHQLCANDRKQMHRLPYKLLNVATETETHTITNTSIFKSITSGEIVETEKLYQMSGFEMQTFVKNCFLMNQLPNIKYGSEGDMRRIRPLYFGETFSGDARDPELRRKLRSEWPGILALLVNRLPQLWGLKELPQGGKTSYFMWKAFCRNTDIVRIFWNTCVRFHDRQGKRLWNGSLSKDNLYAVFQRYCRQNDRSVMPIKAQFFKISKGLFPDLDFDFKRYVGGNNYVNSVRGCTFTQEGFKILEVH